MSVLSVLSGRGAAAAVAVAVTLTLVAPAPAAEAQEDAAAAAAAAEERIRRLEEQLAALRAELEALRAERESAGPGAPDRPAEADAQTAPEGAEPAGLAELERRLDLLAAEIERLTLGEAAAEADVAERGLGPAASKVYRTGRGLSIGGYGELLYQGFDSSRDDGARSGRRDTFDLLRAIVYVGYKFDDRWLLNTEIEYEHAGEEVSVEFAYLDYLWRPELNARGGLLLVPVGFLNELHEPTAFLGAKRPDVERAILPTTWRENGLGIYGDAGPLTYRAYLVNGLDASGFAAGGLRGGRQKGSEALAEDLAWVGRVDWTAVPGLLAGASLYTGGSGQGLVDPAGGVIDARTTLVEGHLEWRARGLRLRALGVRGEVDEAERLNRALGLAGGGSVGEELEGWYVEAGYDLWAGRSDGRSLTPYVRWEQLDTQAAVPAGFARDPANDVESLTVGVAFQPIDQVIFKADYQDYENGAGTGVDQLNVGIGWIF